MDFKSLLSQLDQLNEATTKTKTGIKHTAEPGGYGRKDDEDDEGKKVKAKDTEKKGRGRPKKATQSSGEDKKYDFSAFGVKTGKDVKLPKYDKKKTTKHSLKEYLDSVHKSIVEAEQIEIKPASQMPKKPGQTSQPGQQQQQQVAGQQAQNTQVISQGDKTLGTVNNPQLAQQIKQSIGKGEMTLMPGEEMHEEDIGKHNNATTGFDALVRKLTPKYGVEAAKRIAGAQLKKMSEGDAPGSDFNMLSPISGSGLSEGKKPVKDDNKAEKAGKKVTKDLEYDMKHKGKDDAKAEKAGKKVTKDIEYDMKKKKIKEAAKPDFPDIDDDGNKKETIAKAAQDAKKDKKKVKEGMDHKLKAAYHEGKAHGLSKRSYNCTHDDMEEARQYHEGYKCGLDECYGQMPVQGLVVGENNPSVVDNMASFGAHTPTIADEGNAFTAALAKTPDGGKFSLGGKTFTDRSALESHNPFDINEDVEMKSWDSELDSLLNENAIAEGVTISSSTGQQGSPDSVTVSASDADASAVLNMIKQLGLGGFGGGEEQSAGQPMTVDGGAGPEAEIEVVDDHDDMLSLIRKMTGQGAPEQSGDYEDEEGGHEEHGHEEPCETCNESPCGCNEEVVDEEQSEDQMEYQVAETEGGGDDAEEQEEMASDATRDAALAQSSAEQDPTVNEGGDGGEAGTDGIAADDAVDMADAEEEDLDESYANGADDTFESDIDFMTKVISGGLNKQKSTGQSTIPVVSAQVNRLGNPMKESTDLLTDWKKLSGIR
jgi:hypothetical protein